MLDWVFKPADMADDLVDRQRDGGVVVARYRRLAHPSRADACSCRDILSMYASYSAHFATNE